VVTKYKDTSIIKMLLKVTIFLSFNMIIVDQRRDPEIASLFGMTSILKIHRMIVTTTETLE